MKLALHWKILIGLVLGVVVGIAIDATWSGDTWTGLGVDHPPAFKEGRRGAVVPVLPLGVVRVSELDPADPALADRQPFELTKAQIAKHGLKTVPANKQIGAAARILRVAIHLNDFVGKLFLQCLKFLAVPIVFFSLIAGAASLGNPRQLGRIGGKTILVYLGTTVVAVVIGLVLANTLRPGAGLDAASRDRLVAGGELELSQKLEQSQSVSSTWQLLLETVPANPFGALASGQMLQIIVFALVIGVGLTLIAGQKAKPVIEVVDSLSDVFVVLVRLLMHAAPYAVFALIVAQVATMGMGMLKALSMYAGTMALGLAILLFLEYPLLLIFLARVKPSRFFKAMAPAQLLALSSSSSAATLPVTMDCAHRRLGVPERYTSFVCPLGATINMDGTALYQGIAVVFIAQLFGTDLTLADQLSVVLLATLASIGSPGIPSGGIIMLLVILQSLGLNPAGIAIVLAVDRPLDMLRTVVNVSGDGMAAAIVARSEGAVIAPPSGGD